MKISLKNLIFNLIPREYFYVLQDFFRPKTFGQLGEDAVIENHLQWLNLPFDKSGMYLDIGAFHPTRGSNTFRFYKKGCKGYVIDVGKKKKKIWSIFRPRDTFIEAVLVSNYFKEDKVLFSMASEYGIETDHIVSSGIKKEDKKIKLYNSKVISVNSLEKIINEDKNWKNANWKFINIDIEGGENEIIKEFNFLKLNADVIAIEYFHPNVSSFSEKFEYIQNFSNLNKSLKKNYMLQSICGPTLIFVKSANSKTSK